jgi:hypothetical protein
LAVLLSPLKGYSLPPLFRLGGLGGDNWLTTSSPYRFFSLSAVIGGSSWYLLPAGVRGSLVPIPSSPAPVVVFDSTRLRPPKALSPPRGFQREPPLSPHRGDCPLTFLGRVLGSVLYIHPSSFCTCVTSRVGVGRSFSGLKRESAENLFGVYLVSRLD